MPPGGNRGPAGLANLRCWPRTTASLPNRPPAAELVTPSADRADGPAATRSRPRHPAGRAPAHPAPGALAARQIGHICAPERQAPKKDDGRAERRVMVRKGDAAVLTGRHRHAMCDRPCARPGQGGHAMSPGRAIIFSCTSRPRRARPLTRQQVRPAAGVVSGPVLPAPYPQGEDPPCAVAGGGPVICGRGVAAQAVAR